MILSFHPCFVADAQIILRDRDLNSDDLAHIRDAEIIILPQSCSFHLYQICKNSSALLFPNYEARFKYPGKIGQCLLFKKMGCPHPKTLIWPSVARLKKEYKSTGDLPHRIPFLIKSDESHEAEGIYIITDQKAVESSLDNLPRFEKYGSSEFISQELIPSEGNVLRVVILGRRTITYWKRPKNPEQIITTVNQGAKIDRDWRVDLQEKGKIQVEKFSVATNINLAAIDLVFDFTQLNPKPLFLEINYYFGRRGLGGSLNYYRLLLETIQEWLDEKGFNTESVTLV